MGTNSMRLGDNEHFPPRSINMINLIDHPYIAALGNALHYTPANSVDGYSSMYEGMPGNA